MRTITYDDGAYPAEIHLSATQEKNLRKLAAYLARLPRNYKKFSMRDYFLSFGFEKSYARRIPKNECGTVACAVGHGPTAGIRAKDRESWVSYCDRVFNPSIALWHWCFAGSWSQSDDTPLGAAKRITWMLDKGKIPNNYEGQMIGKAPLCYRRVKVPV